MRDPEARDERLRQRRSRAASNVARSQRTYPLLGRLLAHDALELHRIAGGLRLELLVLDDVLGRLRDDVALLVEPAPAGAPRDLLEVADAQDGSLLAVELAEPREEHRAERDIDPDAERVGTADDGEQTALGELLDQQPVLRKQARVMDADAVGEEALHLLAVRRVEAHLPEGLGDGALALLGHEVHAHQVLRRLGRGALREVDDVDRRAALGDQIRDGLVQGSLAVLEVEGHRPLRGAHGDGGPLRPLQ